MEIVPTFSAAKQFHSQRNKAMPMLGEKTYRACDDWWINEVTVDALVIFVSNKKLKRDNNEQKVLFATGFLQLATKKNFFRNFI